MLESKDRWQILDSSGALDLTFASQARCRVGSECRIRSTSRNVHAAYLSALCQCMHDHRPGHRCGWSDEQGRKILFGPRETASV